MKSPVHTATVKFWKKILPHYLIYISELVKIEIGGVSDKERRYRLIAFVKDFKILPVSEEAVDLSKEYLKLLKIPERDALHIAIATIEGIDYLVSWNMRHLARERTRYAVDFVNTTLLLKKIYILTPLDFMEKI